MRFGLVTFLIQFRDALFKVANCWRRASASSRLPSFINDPISRLGHCVLH